MIDREWFIETSVEYNGHIYSFVLWFYRFHPELSGASVTSKHAPFYCIINYVKDNSYFTKGEDYV